ncbi:hypothetical protein NQ314_013727 [Rhamnusium bicolor]|uniref:Laminin EGF-like domain-containing protein n=1 Tax=Rhamnusium bicolor TaxID=1586634 RepID=A0AAV8X584_9CUCU|nr:hypothetical protein NQ314_013727 [Rhamnusium bicolor]
MCIFATACDLSSDGEKISCDCIEGYIGARCHSCAPGYYGRPEVAGNNIKQFYLFIYFIKEVHKNFMIFLGDYCKPCQCSGNINPKDPSSCDTVTGDCLRCLNNTFGQACSLCAPGYFGDAVNLKDCQGNEMK